VDAAEWHEQHGQVQVQQGQQVVAGFLNEVAAATDPLTFAQARSPPNVHEGLLPIASHGISWLIG
jgi:hypothetical protein